MPSSDLPVVTSAPVTRGRCKYCRQPIVWATVASRGHGLPAKTLPFSRRPIPERSERNDETGLTIEWWPAGELHFKHCKNHPASDRRRSTAARDRAAARHGQGRLL